MPRHPTFGMATPSIILIPVVEGIGPCPPACDRQSPHHHRGQPSLVHTGTPLGDPISLLTHVFRYDFMNWTSRPFFFASGSSRLHKNYYYHSCRSLILGAWELWTCFGEIKGFGAFRLHYIRCAFRGILDIGCFTTFCIGTKKTEGLLQRDRHTRSALRFCVSATGRWLIGVDIVLVLPLDSNSTGKIRGKE